MTGRTQAERQHVQELELRHGVLIRREHDGAFSARHWEDDSPVADADSLRELGIILTAAFVFPRDGSS